MRYALCEATSAQSFGKGVPSERIISSFRQRVSSLWGDLGLASFGSSTSVVYNFLDFCGIFVLKLPATSADKCLAALSSMIELNGRPVTVRVVHVSGRLSNTVRAAQERLLEWRRSVPPQYEVTRKDQLDGSLKEGLAILGKDSSIS